MPRSTPADDCVLRQSDFSVRIHLSIGSTLDSADNSFGTIRAPIPASQILETVVSTAMVALSLGDNFLKQLGFPCARYRPTAK